MSLLLHLLSKPPSFLRPLNHRYPIKLPCLRHPSFPSLISIHIIPHYRVNFIIFNLQPSSTFLITPTSFPFRRLNPFLILNNNLPQRNLHRLNNLKSLKKRKRNFPLKARRKIYRILKEQ